MTQTTRERVWARIPIIGTRKHSSMVAPNYAVTITNGNPPLHSSMKTTAGHGVDEQLELLYSPPSSSKKGGTTKGKTARVGEVSPQHPLPIPTFKENPCLTY